MSTSLYQHRKSLFIRLFLTALLFLATTTVSSGSCVETVEKVRAEKSQAKREHLKIYWSGAASTILDDGTTSIAIDPFVSRGKNGPADILFRRKAVVEKNLIDARMQRPEIARIRTILVGHSHYDHSLDVPYFAKCTNAKVIGSPSTERILIQSGHSNFISVTPDSVLEKHEVDGRFKVSVFKGEHGVAPLGLNFLDRTVKDPFSSKPTVSEYGQGEVYSYFIEHAFGSVLHIGSAGGVPKSIEHLNGKVDVLMLALVGRGNTKAFLKDIVKAVNPRYVIPIHYDNLFRPLSSTLRVTHFARLDNFLKTMERDFEGVKVLQLGFDEPWALLH